MPEFAVFVRSSAAAETDAPPKKDIMDLMKAYNDTLKSAGVLERVGGLLPSSKGTRLDYTSSSGDPSEVKVTPGPFPADSLVAGFWIIKVKNLDEAVEWAKKVPFQGKGSPVVEIRKIADKDDFEELDV